MEITALSPKEERLRPLLKALPARLLEFSHLVRFAEDQTVVLRNDPVEKAYYILEGELSVCNETSDGKLSVWLTMQAPTVISDLEILSEASHYAANVRTITPCTALQCSVADLTALLHSDIDFLWQVSTMVTQKNYQLSHGRGNAAFRSSHEKTALYLLQYCEQHPHRQNAPTVVLKTRPAMASEVIVSQKTLDRSLTRLEEDGCISIVKGKVHISAQQHQRLLERYASPE